MFCNHCGAELQTSQQSCSSCGKPVGVVAAPTPQGRLAHHLRLVGVLWIALSAIRLLGAVACLIVANTVLRGISEVPEFVPAIVSFVGGWLLVLAVGGIAAGWGLLKRESWGRILALIVAFVSLLDIPLGIALGVYTLWVLLPSDAEKEHGRMVRTA
ncbi:MAG: zinc ribbon domain-containing protein [Terriglobia bacterium]